MDHVEGLLDHCGPLKAEPKRIRPGRLVVLISTIIKERRDTMTENPKHRGGRRPGAGRKPSLTPLAIIRLIDPQIRAALVAITADRRERSGNSQLSQEQVVADLIQAAQRQLENSNNQSERPGSSPDETTGSARRSSPIDELRHEVSAILVRLRRKTSVGQREGRRLVDLLTQIIALHAAQIAPWAILEELDRAHNDEADRDRAIAALLQRPLVEYREDGWRSAMALIAAQLDTGPIRRQAEQWALINLAVEITGAALITNDQIGELLTRLQAQHIDTDRWLARSHE